jgi:hypothetical protein
VTSPVVNATTATTGWSVDRSPNRWMLQVKHPQHWRDDYHNSFLDVQSLPVATMVRVMKKSFREDTLRWHTSETRKDALWWYRHSDEQDGTNSEIEIELSQ